MECAKFKNELLIYILYESPIILLGITDYRENYR